MQKKHKPNPDRRFIALLDEVQWLIFRIWRVHSRLRGPGFDWRQASWEFHRPWFCQFLHESARKVDDNHPLSILEKRCEKNFSELIGRSRGSDIGRCGTGLKWVRVVFDRSWSGKWIMVLGPFLDGVRKDTRFKALAGRLDFTEESKLHWGFRLLPVLDSKSERRMVESVKKLIGPLFERFKPMFLGKKWEELVNSGEETGVESVYSPIRTGEDEAASINAIFVEFHEGTPPYLSGRYRDGIYELTYVQKGSSRVIHGNKESTLKAGMGFINLPGADFRMVPKESESLSTVSISFTGRVPLCEEIAGRPLIFNARIQTILSDLCSQANPRVDDSHRSSSNKILLMTMLMGLRSSMLSGKITSVLPSFERNRRRFLADRIKDYIDTNLESQLVPSDLARVSGVSIATMYRMFMFEFGLSPYRYITRQRVGRAQQLLRDTKMNIGEVATRLHFSNQFHFSRVFKSITKQSPSQFSRSVRFETDIELNAGNPSRGRINR